MLLEPALAAFPVEFFDGNLGSALRLCFQGVPLYRHGIAHNVAVLLRRGDSILAAGIMLYATSMRGRPGSYSTPSTIVDLSFGKLVQLRTYGGPQ